MIITCENCKTRFNLADERIPAAGAKVRCSRCQHSFQVVRPRPKPAQDLGLLAADEDNPLLSPEEAEPEASELGEEQTAAQGEDPLFGTGLEDPSEIEKAEELGAEPVIGFEQPGAPPGPQGDAAAVAPFDSPAELGEAGDADPDPVPIMGIDDAASEDPMGSWDPFDEKPARGGVDLAPLAKQSSESEGLVNAPFADLAEEPWDPNQPAPIPDLSDAAPTVVDEVKAKPTSAKGQAAESVQVKPASEAWWMPVLAGAVALALIVAGVRTVGPHALRPVPGPERLERNGWVASQIEARHTHDRRGQSVLVVRGQLEAQGAGSQPRVEVTLLDAGRRPLGGAIGGRLVHGGSPGWRVTGFVVVIPEPPSAAVRYRLELLPG